MAETLTRAQALDLFDYHQESGSLFWRRSPKIGVKAGSLVGYQHPSGYRATKVKGEQYLLHRIVWLLEHGSWPDCDIDHINRDRSDNRVQNLRLASRAENCQNVATRRAGASGVVGVSWHKQTRRWRASIRADGRAIHLGSFMSVEDASAARLAGERTYHPFRPGAF